MKRPGFLVVWPSNFDSAKTRGRGRKVAQPRAVRQPRLRELVQAATVLGYGPEAVEGASRPGMAWEKTGYVVIKKPGRRVDALRLLGLEIVKARQREAQAAEAKPSKR